MNITIVLASLIPLASVSADGVIPDMPASISSSVIDGNVLSGARGRNAVNIAAGDANAQINAAAIALTPNGTASAGVITQQQNNRNASGVNGISVSNISGNAFQNNVGALSINQTSGVGNTQANAMLIGVGLEVNVMTESMLSDTTTGAGLAASEPDTGTRNATISDGAFSGSRGLVQVNQSAGSGNSTANSFVLQIELGTD